MANPFSVFRKNRKMMLALLTLMAMVGFVVGDILSSISGSGNRATQAVVNTARYGDLSEEDLQRLRGERQIVLQFLQAIPQAVLAPASDAFQEAQDARRKADQAKERLAGVSGGPESNVEYQGLQKTADALQKNAEDLGNQLSSQYARVNYLVQQVSGQIGPPTEEAVVQTWFLAKRAQELGLSVNDEAINDFINGQLLEDPVTRELVVAPEQVQSIFDGLGVSDKALFQMLENELLALRLKDLFWFSLSPSTPAERWDYYRRLNRKATVELAQLPVSKYTASVSAPSEAVLREFFEKRAKQPFSPASPEPGFLVPKKVVLEYYKGQYEKIVDPASVPEQEVKDYYELKKDELYKRAKLPEVEPAQPGGPELDPGAGSLPGVNAPEPAIPAAAKAQQGAEQPAAKPAEPTDQAAPSQPETRPQPEKKESADGEKTIAPVKADVPKTGKPDSPKPGKTDGSSSAGPAFPFRLVSLAEEDQPAKKDEKPVAPRAEKPAEPSQEAAKEKPAEPSQEAAKEKPAEPSEEPAKEKPAEPSQEPAKEKPAEPSQEPAKKRPEAAAVAKPGQAAPVAGNAPAAPAKAPAEAGSTAAPAAPPTEYVPFKEVEAEIRDRLARARVEELLNKLRDQVASFASEQKAYEFQAEGSKQGGKIAPPKPLDYEAQANQHNLTFHQTGSISALEAQRLDVAQSNLAGVPSIVSYIFDQAAEHRPEISQDTEDNYYLFWVKQKTDQREPKFDEPGVRAQVLEAWKLVQARDLAVKQAEALAAEARKSGKPLKETLAGRPDLQVIETEPFSWMTSNPLPYLASQMPPQLSEIKQKLPADAPAGQTASDAVEMPGEDLMRTVFELDQGGVAPAMNQPKTTAYVVRVIEFNPQDNVLQGPFLKGDYSTYHQAGWDDRSELYRTWLQRIETYAGLKWQREPYRAVQR